MLSTPVPPPSILYQRVCCKGRYSCNTRVAIVHADSPLLKFDLYPVAKVSRSTAVSTCINMGPLNLVLYAWPRQNECMARAWRSRERDPLHVLHVGCKQ